MTSLTVSKSRGITIMVAIGTMRKIMWKMVRVAGRQMDLDAADVSRNNDNAKPMAHTTRVRGHRAPSTRT